MKRNRKDLFLERNSATGEYIVTDSRRVGLTIFTQLRRYSIEMKEALWSVVQADISVTDEFGCRIV